MMLEGRAMSEKRTEKDPVIKVTRHRLSVLEMADALGNIWEACRRSGMDGLKVGAILANDASRANTGRTFSHPLTEK